LTWGKKTDTIGRYNLLSIKKIKEMNMPKKMNAGFMKELTPSADLAQIVGAKPLPRTEVVKKLWAYIKKLDLQDKKNRRQINADDKLRAVFGGKASVNMFEMTKLVSKHLS
jgi:chromatin remodeling complex protein RSC6